MFYKILAILAVTFGLQAGERLDIWKYAYQGDYNLTHKSLLLRDNYTMDEILSDNLIMAYFYYRTGDQEGVESIFRGIDSVVSKYMLYGSGDSGQERSIELEIANKLDSNKQ